MSNPIILPSMEEIEQMEKQRSQAIEALQINENDNTVKCQTCSIAVPLLRRLTTKPNSIRIGILQTRIKWMENYSRISNINDLQQLKAELADLLEEYAKYDKLRSLPLYSCRITGWKFVCSKCYDKVYNILVQRP
jgi:hypothetical protein